MSKQKICDEKDICCFHHCSLGCVSKVFEGSRMKETLVNLNFVLYVNDNKVNISTNYICQIIKKIEIPP